MNEPTRSFVNPDDVDVQPWRPRLVACSRRDIRIQATIARLVALGAMIENDDEAVCGSAHLGGQTHKHTHTHTHTHTHIHTHTIDTPLTHP